MTWCSRSVSKAAVAAGFVRERKRRCEMKTGARCGLKLISAATWWLSYATHMLNGA